MAAIVIHLDKIALLGLPTEALPNYFTSQASWDISKFTPRLQGRHLVYKRRIRSDLSNVSSY